MRITVRDEQDQAVPRARVRLFTEVDFFATGVIELGQVVTDETGTVLFEFTPRQVGALEITASYGDAENKASINLLPEVVPLYKTHAGIKFPPLAGERIIGPESAKELGGMGTAPTSGLYLGGTLPFFLLLPLGVGLIWFTYFYVMRSVFLLAPVSRTGASNRLVPALGMLLIAITGLVLILMVVTGPFSHFHII